MELENVYLPFDQYEESVTQAGYAMNAKGDAPRIASASLEYKGWNYLIVSAVHGDIESSRKSAYKLVPEHLWDGPIFDTQAHEDINKYSDEQWSNSVVRPDGYERHRGDATGCRVYLKNESVILVEPVMFKPLLPDTTAWVTPAEAQAFEDIARRSGWRALGSVGDPHWHQIDDVLVAEFETDFDTMFMAYAVDKDNEIFTFQIAGLESIDRMRGIERDLNFVPTPKAGHQMAML